VSLSDVVLGWTVQTLLLLTLAGILTGGLAHRAKAFTAYLLIVVVGEGVTLLRPEVFWTFDQYVIRQLGYLAMKVVIAAELAAEIFDGFPTAQRAARRVVGAILLVTFVVVVTMPLGADRFDHLGVEQILARLANGVLWLFVGLAAVARWYVVPLHRLQKAIVMGFGTFGLVSVVCFNFMHWTEPVKILIPTAYLMLVTYWAWTAWNVREEADSPAIARLRRAHA
jgi:hypothetical protein